MVQDALPKPQSEGNPDGTVAAWNKRSDAERKSWERTQGPVELPANDLTKFPEPVGTP
jgi:hypothetical protein